MIKAMAKNSACAINHNTAVEKKVKINQYTLRTGLLDNTTIAADTMLIASSEQGSASMPASSKQSSKRRLSHVRPRTMKGI